LLADIPEAEVPNEESKLEREIRVAIEKIGEVMQNNAIGSKLKSKVGSSELTNPRVKALKIIEYPKPPSWPKAKGINIINCSVTKT
jgi:hypothetical protein